MQDDGSFFTFEQKRELTSYFMTLKKGEEPSFYDFVLTPQQRAQMFNDSLHTSATKTLEDAGDFVYVWKRGKMMDFWYVHEQAREEYEKLKKQ